MQCCESRETVGHEARVLSPEEVSKLERDKTLLSEFKQNKLECDAQKNWDIFYKRNTTKFFKDRHWTRREFADLVTKDEGSPTTVLEVGCGVGNFIFPLLEEDKSLYFHACDFSKRAVDFVKAHPQFDPGRLNVFQCDITASDLQDTVPVDSIDVASMIFVLSAIHPEKMVTALCNIIKVLKPGGCLLFRDYGLYDYAMLRFAPGHKLSENLYVRQDGTRAYYFSREKIEGLMSQAGFIIDENEYVQRETVNKKEGLCVPRIFVQGKFIKPKSGLTDVSKIQEAEEASVPSPVLLNINEEVSDLKISGVVNSSGECDRDTMVRKNVGFVDVPGPSLESVDSVSTSSSHGDTGQTVNDRFAILPDS